MPLQYGSWPARCKVVLCKESVKGVFCTVPLNETVAEVWQKSLKVLPQLKSLIYKGKTVNSVPLHKRSATPFATA